MKRHLTMLEKARGHYLSRHAVPRASIRAVFQSSIKCFVVWVRVEWIFLRRG
jgi:hypothetical protein